MKYLPFFLTILLFSCNFDVSGLPENNNSTNNNTNSCTGDPPAGDLNTGVCSNSHKICVNGAWVEPDYSLIENFEENETKCDSLDNDCDGIVDAGECRLHESCGFINNILGCYCSEGYELDGDICVDINECAANPCDENAICQNLQGNFSCKCNDGFEGDGFVCTEINECESASCHFDANCIDGINSYSCVCKNGFEGDGYNTCYPNSCRILKENHPGITADGTYTIDTGTGGPIDVFCDFTSDMGTGYTMVKFVDSNLGTSQDDYRNLCASHGMEVIVPRTRAHALAIKHWLSGHYPPLVNVFPKYDGAVGLNNFEGRCNGSPCSFYLSNKNTCYNNFEPSGNNSTNYSLYLWFQDAGDWGGWDDNNNTVDSGFSGSVVCSTNDNPDPPTKTGCLEYVNSNTVWNKSPYGISGVYKINPTGNGELDAWCEQIMDGGGWTLVLNYVHQGGTNPLLNVKTDSLPIIESSTLGDDEQNSTLNWGHASNSMLSQFDISEIGFYGESSAGRRMVFSTVDASCISYIKTGVGNCSPDLSDNFHGMKTQNANLPQLIDSGFADQGDLALTEFPFYNDGNYYWAVKGSGNRWEVDTAVGDDSLNTIHRVFIRTKPKGSSCLDILTNYPNSKSGYYSIDPDGAGGSPPFITYCDMRSDGGGWTLVAIYGHGFGRPSKWHGATYPRPGASYFNSPTTGTTMDRAVFESDLNNVNFASFSIDASRLWSDSNHEVLAYVGGPTDDYITATLPSGCNYFDASTWCIENTYGPFDIFLSDNTLLTGNGYACTTAHNNDPFAGDIYNEFGLHLFDGLDTNASYNCMWTASSLGFQNIGRLFTTFEKSTGGYWTDGVTSYWDDSGVASQNGALFVR